MKIPSYYGKLVNKFCRVAVAPDEHSIGPVEGD